jgi:DeoR family transcriptional regulator of aga operon/DeoR family fructose operon transcriptional repressor
MTGKLFMQERREKILGILERDERVSIDELSEIIDVTPVTIRNDLNVLAEKGLLVRVHGGAILPDQSKQELSFNIRRRLHSQKKERIGATAAAMIQDGEAIILDASTTAMAVASKLLNHHELTVLTNGILVGMILLDNPSVTVLMPGGFLRRDSASLVKGIGNCDLGKYNFQKGFFGAKGLSLEEGLTDVNRDEVSIKRDFIHQVKTVVAIVDSTKWNRDGFVSFASLDQVDSIITDEEAPKGIVKQIEEKGIKIIIAYE